MHTTSNSVKSAALTLAIALSSVSGSVAAQVNCNDWPNNGAPTKLNLMEAEEKVLRMEAQSGADGTVHILTDAQQNAGLQNYPNLMTNGDRRRSVLGLTVGDNMQAHHIFTMAQVRAMPDDYKKALNSVWQSDSTPNLIALPKTVAAQSAMPKPLPIHNGSHIKYNSEIEARYAKKKRDGENCKVDLTKSPNIKALVESVIAEVRPEIEKGTASKWYPNLCEAQADFCDPSQDSDGD